MSSDQPLSVQIPVVSDLCENKPNDNHELGCSLENLIATENETNSESEISQNSKEIGQTFREKAKLSEIEENVNFDSSEQCGVDNGVGNGYNIDGIEHPDDELHTDRTDAVNCQNGPDGEEKLTSSSSLNNEATTLSVVEEQVVTVDSQTLEETKPQTLTLEQSNEQTSNVSIEREPQEKLSDTENDDDTKEKESLKENEDQPTVTSENSDQIVDTTTLADDEIENDASNDEDEICSNQDSNEDSCEFPDIVDFDGTNEVENDEYILDTVVRKRRKERRRIVSVNDDDSDTEMDVERERLIESPTIEEKELTDNEEIEEDIELLIRNEKPGPKSKKISTQKLKELQARELLRNAVVIPSAKKKKGRIIDSDDDDADSLLPYCVDVDDIGLPDVTEENENENDGDVLEASSILLNDIDKPDSPSVENLSQDPDSSAEISPDLDNAHEVSLPQESEHLASQNPESSECTDEIPQENRQEIISLEELAEEESPDATKNEAAAACDSGNSVDSTNQQCRNEDDSITEIKDFPPFPSSSSSEEEDEFIPNAIYFGTPDEKKGSRGKLGRPRRGRPPQTSSQQIRTSKNVVRSTDKRRGRPSKQDKFIDNRRTSSTSGSTSSSSESDDEYQKTRRKPETITIVKKPLQLYGKGSLPVRPVQQQPQAQRQNHVKQDRFYDKSRDIPNAIYFGDVDVPLHVLYAYDESDSDNDTRINSNSKFMDLSRSNKNRPPIQVARGRGGTIALRGQLHGDVSYQHKSKPFSNNRKARGRPKVSSVSPSNDQSIQMLKKCLKAAGLKKVKLNRLWEGCKSNSERAEKMLELLREKGLEGEPTISKCKQLKVEYLTKKEIEDLDPNLIIQTEGRTRRSVTRAATKRQYTYDEEEVLETRTKLRKVVDSDSDFE